MSVELILATVGAAQQCLEFGKKLVEMYKAFKEAEEGVGEKILIIEAAWSRTSVQMELLTRVACTMRAEHCQIQIEVLEMLKAKFRVAITKVESLLKKGDSGEAADIKVKRWKYVLIRESLDETISELERWQRIFDPTWFLIIRIGDKVIDSELSKEISGAPAAMPVTTVKRRSINPSTSTLVTVQNLRGMLKSDSVHITLDQEGLDWDSARPVPYSTTQLIRRAGSDRAYLVDSIPCNSDIDVPRARADAEALAKKLKQVEPLTFGLLSCPGLVKRRTSPAAGTLRSIDLVFRLPPKHDSHPISLRQRLLEHPPVSLTVIIDIARQLAKAVSFVHTCEFVHKNIRPETVLLFPELTASPHAGPGATLHAGSPAASLTDRPMLPSPGISPAVPSVSRTVTPTTAPAAAPGEAPPRPAASPPPTPTPTPALNLPPPQPADDADAELAPRGGPCTAYLLGFDRFRSVNFATLRRGDAAWERNLYRHPARQGLRAHDDYAMQHDVYALGVCLLELGLWESFVTYQQPQAQHLKDDDDDGGGSSGIDGAQDTDKVPSPVLGLSAGDFALGAADASPAAGGRIKDRLVALARAQLPQRMGDRYTAVVVTCLTCLDDGNEDFGDDEDMCDDDGVLIGVRFIEKVLLRLGEIVF